ncbi:MAG: hypothetical protein NC248_07230 [Bacteroides sp.]|nr:hypothetical protein [Bacteroides sp.]MCM1389651.1 hypothetical protein [Bacteroides sp.]
MRFKFLHMTPKSPMVASIMMAFIMLAVSSCTDDLLYDPAVIGEGEAAITADLNFYEISSRLESRAVTGGTPGNEIGAINSVCVLAYDLEGNLVKKYTRADLEDYDYKPADNTSSPSDAINAGEHQAEAATGRATFKIGVTKVENRLPFGKYRIYAVANMGDLADYDLSTEEKLHSIRLKWDAENIGANNQMFGYFTENQATEHASEGFIGKELVINNTSVSLHSWVKRAVSKVTVAFDGRGLKENIWIFVKSVEIKDIPDSCYLADYNPGDPSKLIAGDRGVKLPLVTEGQKITYHEGDTYNADSWEEYISKGHPILGYDTEKAFDTNLKYEERLAAQHTESVNALYFFENMQGKGKEGTASDKRQQVNDDDKKDHVTSYPDGIKPGNEAWKDAKPHGTYIEVKAYYRSLNPGDPGQGDIIYRFMLGKDVTLDYNAQRNYHYKLTLRFNGYANDVDWHIDYKKEDRKIQNPNPYYISYLYNHSMMLPLDIDAGSATIEKLELKIESNNWAPMGASDGVSTTPGADAYALYWNKMDNPTAYPYNGFLSLQETDQTVIMGKSPFNIDANSSYYNSNPKRGERTYTNFVESGKSIVEALEDGEMHVQLKKNDDGYNHYILNIPMWTRAKQLIKETAYTGNNPFVAYQREAKVKVLAILSDGDTLTTGITTNNGSQSGEPISIRQVRRIVNPKGVYRRADNNADFHVVLNILPSEESTTFKPLPSDGPWRAYVIRDTRRGEDNADGWNDADGTIRLEGSFGTTNGSMVIKDKNGKSRTYQTIEGATGSNMDFTIKFNGKTTSDDQPNHAVIRVEYHNYTCYHLIFVRQGYGADNIVDGGAKWMASNNVAKGKVAKSPLDEGSMFRFGNWNQPIASSNNKNGKSTWTNVVPDDFKKNAADDKELALATSGKAKWIDINYKITGNWQGPSDVEFEEQSGMRVATQADYAALYSGKNPDIEQGYGVLYGDDSTETLTNINDVYGYMSSGDGSGAVDKGMRGCFVYNFKTGKNLFFPIGASGYGHRINLIKDASGTEYRGLLRYNCSKDRWGYFDTSRLPANTELLAVYPDGVDDCPLLFDAFRRPGAVYWYERPVDKTVDEVAGTYAGWDINYFTLDFFQITSSMVGHGADACFVRSIKL